MDKNRRTRLEIISRSTKMQIAIIGTQGLPNKYGGFETLVDYLTKNLSEEFDFTVFCSSKIYENKIKFYNNSKLVYLPFNANGFQSLFYDSLSLILSIKYDKILVLGSSGGFVLPLVKLFNKGIILNFGGLDWQRSKWSFFTKKILLMLEKLAVMNSAVLVSDNLGIQNYISKRYFRDSLLIEYGGDQIYKVNVTENLINKYSFLQNKYAFSVARIQPDNNIDIILEAFEKTNEFPLVFVGNWLNSEYGRKLKIKFSNKSNIILLDAIYNLDELNALRGNCTLYIHGHSAGGTNPSLVEAMNYPLAIVAFDSDFNKYTTENKALYFSNAQDLVKIIKNNRGYDFTVIRQNLKEIADRRYKWSIISNKYKELLNAKN